MPSPSNRESVRCVTSRACLVWSCLLHRALRRCSRHTKAYSSFPSGHTILRLSSSCFRRHLVTYHGVLAPGASLRYRVVPQGDEDGDQDELDEDCAAPEAARSDEAAAGSEAPPVARVPHRPGKWRRAVRRYYTWAELCAVGVRRGDLYVPKLRRSASAAGSDQGPGFDRAGAAGHGVAV
jgi:hypothetical protein